MAKAKAAVAAKEVQDVDFLNSMSGEGTNCIGAGDTSANYLKIAQPNSPELTADDDNAIPGLKVGHFYSSLLKKSYGKSISMVVLKFEHAWNVWAPNRGGLVAKLPVNGCKVMRGERGKMTDYEGNDVIETQNFYVTLADHPEDGMLIFSLTSTGIKHGRKWNTMLTTARTPDGKGFAPIFGVVWQLEALKNQNKAGTWYTIGDDHTTAVQQERFITGEEYSEHIKAAYTVAKAIPTAAQAMIASETNNQLALGEDDPLSNV